MRDGHDRRAQELHAAHVRRLLFDVHHAHVDVALEAEVRGRRGECDAVLAGAGLGDELLLAHVLGQQALAHAVVELVRAGVVEVLALQVDLRAAVGQRERACVIHGRRASLEVLAQVAKLGDEGRVVLDLVVRLDDLGEGASSCGGGTARRTCRRTRPHRVPTVASPRVPPRPRGPSLAPPSCSPRALAREWTAGESTRPGGRVRPQRAPALSRPASLHSMKYSMNSLARPSSSSRTSQRSWKVSGTPASSVPSG